MRISHHVGLHISPDVRRHFAQAGIDLVPIAGTQAAVLDINESDPTWPKIKPLVNRSADLDIVSTYFTEKELALASFVWFEQEWMNGYPQPEEGYLETTYDGVSRCFNCGTGEFQIGPFRLRGNPKWGSRSAFTLNWIPDEIFVKSELWKAAFEPLGIRCKPVLSSRGNKVLETVVQVDIPLTLSLDLGHRVPRETCPICGRAKFGMHRRGKPPGPPSVPDGVHAFKTAEYFGSDHMGYRQIVFSAELYQRLAEFGHKGIRFLACDECRPGLEGCMFQR